MAKESPYYKRNHMGKVTCTLCNIYCNDENNFIKHISGKTHTMSLERIEQMERRQRHLKEEDQRNLEAYARAQQEQRARELVLQQQSSSSGSTANANAGGVSSSIPALTGVHGLPQYTFKTEHDPVRFCTKIWLEFFFPHAEEGTRPAHRWMSAREQKVEVHSSSTADQDYFVYLLVACEGYTTAALKFPSGARRTTEDEERWRKMQQHDNGNEEDPDDDGPRYKSTWNGLRRQYSIFFELYR